MREVMAILDEAFVAQERVSRDEIYRRALAAEVPADVVMALGGLPEGEYAYDELAEALALPLNPDPRTGVPAEGIPADELTDDELLRELAGLHRTRNDTLRHGSESALDRHSSRTVELEAEYLRRFPQREVWQERLRAGARARSGQPA